MSYTSQALQEIPSVISPDDRKRLDVTNMLDMEPRVALYQEMTDRYSDSHPFLLVRLADLFVLLNAGTLAIALYRKAQGILSTTEIVKSGLDALVEDYGLKIDEQVNATLARARENSYYQTWKQTKVHAATPFPLACRSFHRRLKKLRVNGRS
ncbi:hypothetical protein LshimejAT787_0801190 [Lyophyllum shimeji]|uniref:Uncharacterized protein n=1 Tax=Lyophyllum shimeji TaxID=47721 RepID=A0A9P3PRI0_LYOSH|nr:hypothetical protein LshimejAT787_0801190 [Lyophyllum shimeji]